MGLTIWRPFAGLESFSSQITNYSIRLWLEA